MTMSTHGNKPNYFPVEHSTPKQSRDNTPISTPSRAALLKPNFLMDGSPIKFSLTPEKLKDIELDDWEDEKHESTASRIGRVVLLVLSILTWVILLTAALYL